MSNPDEIKPCPHTEVHKFSGYCLECGLNPEREALNNKISQLQKEIAKREAAWGELWKENKRLKSECSNLKSAYVALDIRKHADMEAEEIMGLIEKLEKARAALKYYADPQSKTFTTCDYERIARKALRDTE